MTRFVIILFGMLCIIACSSESDSEKIKNDSRSVTIVTSLGGGGDNGYNDLILSGALDFYHNNEVRFSLQRPEETEEVSDIIDKWIAETHSESQALLVLASDTYKPLLASRLLNLSEGQCILVLECEHDGLPEGVSSMLIRRYGASFLAGTLASESPEAHIIAAMPDNAMLQEAIDGFEDGYRSLSSSHLEVHYLATDYTGFSLPNKAYWDAADIGEAFIFPLAGGSNNGIYKYSREDKYTLQLICGMDVDCSEYSTRIPFSLVVRIDKVVHSLLEDWYQTGSLPEHTEYSLDSAEGVIDLVMNTHFMDRVMTWVEYYSSPDYWQSLYVAHRDEAIRKEREYYED